MLTIIVNGFIELSRNSIFWAALTAWFAAQSIKVAFGVVKERKLDLHWFVDTGGLPSSHTAAVCALSAAVGLNHGFDSALFAIAVTFTIIVMCDAQGVRMATGRQSEILNKMLEDDYWKSKMDEAKLKELTGHTPVEVFAGMFLGIVVALLFYR